MRNVLTFWVSVFLFGIGSPFVSSIPFRIARTYWILMPLTLDSRCHGGSRKDDLFLEIARRRCVCGLFEVK
ncbi:hypothetical protein BDR26DRAFT_852944 [Obelidium mucronatum]|nr:hypothetical protein BDR26DRAFT_852944 [Obelidium mucronatum]